VIDATWWTVTRIVAGVKDLVQRTGDSQAQLGYSVTGRSGGRMTLCAICTVHMETRSASFLVWPQNESRRFVSRLSSKPVGQVFRFGHQNPHL
jgi:hypothetical protein